MTEELISYTWKDGMTEVSWVSLQTHEVKLHFCTQSKKQHNKHNPTCKATQTSWLMDSPSWPHRTFILLKAQTRRFKVWHLHSSVAALLVEVWLHRNYPVSVCIKSCPSVSILYFPQKCWWPRAAHPVTAHTVLPFFIKIKNPIDFYFSCFRYQLLLTTATAVPYQYLMSRVRWNGEALWVSPSKWSLWGLRFCGLCLFFLSVLLGWFRSWRWLLLKDRIEIGHLSSPTPCFLFMPLSLCLLSWVGSWMILWTFEFLDLDEIHQQWKVKQHLPVCSQHNFSLTSFSQALPSKVFSGNELSF